MTGKQYLLHSKYAKSQSAADRARWNVVYLSIAGVIDSLLDFWCVYLFSGHAQQRIIRGLRLDLFGAILRCAVCTL